MIDWSEKTDTRWPRCRLISARNHAEQSSAGTQKLHRRPRVSLSATASPYLQARATSMIDDDADDQNKMTFFAGGITESGNGNWKDFLLF